MAGLSKEDVCVLIAAFNEEKRIAAVVKEVRARGFSVVVADDGSADATAAVARAAGATVLETPANEGKGSALRRGLEHFLKTNSKAVILMDADGQHDPADLDLFLEALGQDRMPLIVGNRMAKPVGMSLVRRLTNRFMSWLLSKICGQDVPDSQCGFRAMKREAAERISLRSDRFEIESEMILEAARAGFDIGSIPVQCLYAGEASRVRPIRDTWRFFKFLFASSAWRR